MRGHALRSTPGVQPEPPPPAIAARISVACDPHTVKDEWLALQAEAPCSPYQTWAWNLAWMETEGALSGISPMIVVAYGAAGRPMALLPFGVRQTGLVMAAGFLGGKHSNYNMGLFAPGATWSAASVVDLLRRGARALPTRLDVYTLTNQPMTWDGIPNPLAALRLQPSPSSSYSVALPADPETFFKTQHSAAHRKKMRSKLTALRALGSVEYRPARDPDDIRAVLDAFLGQKSAGLRARGLIDTIEPSITRAFLERAVTSGSDGASLELHALRCGDRIVATFGGLAHAKRFSGQLISYDAEPAVARCSPGDQLLAAVVTTLCSNGFSSFDLGIGEARYKEAYCPVSDPLFDSFLPLTPLGHAVMARESVRLALKRRIKRSGRALAFVGRLRRWRNCL